MDTAFFRTYFALREDPERQRQFVTTAWVFLLVVPPLPPRCCPRRGPAAGHERGCPRRGARAGARRRCAVCLRHGRAAGAAARPGAAARLPDPHRDNRDDDRRLHAPRGRRPGRWSRRVAHRGGGRQRRYAHRRGADHSASAEHRRGSSPAGHAARDRAAPHPPRPVPLGPGRLEPPDPCRHRLDEPGRDLRARRQHRLASRDRDDRHGNRLLPLVRPRRHRGSRACRAASGGHGAVPARARRRDGRNAHRADRRPLSRPARVRGTRPTSSPGSPSAMDFWACISCR